MNNFNSSTAKGNASGLLSDDEAMSVYRAIPTEQDADKKQALVGLLGSYTEAKRAAGLQPFQQSPEAKQAQAERFEGLYESMDAVDSTLAPEQQSKMQALLATSADPKEAKARMVNMAYIKQLHGKNLPTEWDGANWPAIRASYANQAFGVDKPEITDVELYGAIGGRVKQDKENRAALTALVGKMHEAAFKGESDWMKAYEQSKAPVDPAKPMDAAWADKMRLVAKNSFNQVKEKADRLRPMANDIVGSLARIKGTREGFEDVRGFSMDELIQKIDSVPDADRPLLYSVIAQQVGVSPEIKDEKGVIQQSGESIGRGFVDVAKANKRAISDNPALINARALVAAGDKVAVAGERKPGESMVDWVSRSMQGNYGIVDFAKDVITQSGQPFLRNRRAMTADELDAFKSEVTTMERKRTISDELDELANAVVDPVKGSNFFTKRVLYPALETAAYSAQAFVPYAGLPLLIGSTMGMRSQEMMDRGMSIEDAQKGALASALIEAPMEMIQAKMVAGKLPLFKKLLEVPVEGFAALAKRSAAVLGVQMVEQNVQEAVQDFTPLVVQSVASSLSDSVPGLDWNKELAEYGKGRVDTFWALLPMVMVGTGSATFSDAAFGRQYFNDVRVLKAVGFTEEAVTKIMEAPTLEEKQAIMKSMWSDEQMRVMNGVAQQAAFADMDAEMKASYLESSSAEGAQIRRLEDGRFEVTTPDGELLDETSSVDAALQLARDWNAADQLNETSAIEDMIGYVESFQEAGQSIELMDKSKTLQDRVDAGDFTQEEADGIVQLYTEMGRLNEGATPGSVLITGENEVTKYDARRRIVSDVSRIYDGASPLTVVEEHAEGYLKRRLGDGSVTLEDIARWRKSTGSTVTDASERALIEWFSEQSQAYLVGKSNAEALPATFRQFLSKLRKYLGKILDLSVRLMELEASGKMDGTFKTHLARSVGLDQAHIDAQMRAEEVGQMAGRGTELMGWLKGKLPHPETAKSNGEQLAGELATVWEGFKSPQAARAFFAPKGVYTPLDQVAGQARDDGFAFETADDLLQAIDSSLRGEEVFAEAGTGETFSLSEGFTPLTRSEQQDREYTPAVKTDNGTIIESVGHSNAIRKADSMGLKVGKDSVRGYLTKDGRFLSLMDVAREELAKSRAKPADASNVTVLPDGARMVGPTTFSIEDYRGIHKAPVAEEGASIDNPSNIYPDDIYSAQAARYYGHFGDARDNEAIRIIQGLKGRPNAKVVIYRAVPKFGAENKAKLKELNQLLGYRAQHPFFPLGNKVVAGLEEKYAGEANYDKRQALVKEDLERQVAELEAAVKGDKVVINPGDWVTTTRAYAVDHGESALNGSYDVLKKTVAAKELFTNGDSIHEWGYSPEGSNTTFSITAFHGTPHKVDKFSTSKIGTGEGAQAYGWGLYFAEDSRVATSYKDALSGGFKVMAPDGIKSIVEVRNRIDEMERTGELTQNEATQFRGIAYNSSVNSLRDAIKEYRNGPERFRESRKLIADKFEGLFKPLSEGNLYTVELLPDADAFLDWDKPLSEQSEKVKAALAKLDPDTYAPEGADYDANETGQMVHARLWENLIRSGKAAPATEKLRDAAMKLNKLGISGIRYLDGASRGNQYNVRGAGSYYTVINTLNGQKVAEFNEEGAYAKAKAKADSMNAGGTSNYVIFDESLVKIIEENGKKVEQGNAANSDITMGMESLDRANEIKAVMRKHKIAARVAAADHQGEAFSPEMRKAMEDRLYRVVPNKETVAEALKVVTEKGVGGALELVLSRTSTLTPNVQVALGMALMEHFNAKKQFEKAVEVGERVNELGTELGRGVQAFSLLGNVLDTPEKAQIFLSKKLKSLETALRERKPVIDASKEVLANVQEEALKLLEKWLDEINGVSGKSMASRKAVRTEDLPDITFSLSQDVRKSGIVSVVARMLKESGAVETRKALIEKYGDKVAPHVADILIEAQKQLTAKAAATVKKAKPKVTKPGAAAAEDKGKDRSGPRMSEEEIDNALVEIHATGRKVGFQDQMVAIEEHFQGKRMTDAQIEDTLALGRALGLGGQTSTLEGFDDLVKRFEDEVINRLKVKGHVAPQSLRDAVRKLFETKGVKFTREDIARVFAEKFKVPSATESQNKRLVELAENIRSTPEFSTARTDATVDMMNHVNDILKPVDWVDIGWSLWYANVLSGYNTHFRNLYANTLEQMVSLPLDAMRANPVKTLQLMREMLYGVKAGASIGLAEAKNQLKTGEASVLQTESNKFGSAGTLERVDFAGGQANPFNWLKVVGRALRAEDLFAYATAQEAKARMVAWEMADAKGLIGAERQAEVEKLLNATDEQIGDFSERAAREWDGLSDELKDKGNREQWEARRVKELRLLERDGALIERASEFAARATFNYKPDGFVGLMANSLIDVMNGLGRADTTGQAEVVQKALMTAPKLVVPFVRIVANVLNRGIDYTGVGIARSAFETKRVGAAAGKNEFVAKSADERAMELKRGIFGIVALGVLSSMADPDDPDAVIQIHGSGAGSREKNQALNGPRWMPYSIEFRGKEGSKFYTFQYSPLLIGLALVGNYHDAKRYRKLDEKDLTERLAVAAVGVGSVLLDQSFLSNASDLVKIFGEDGRVSQNALYSFMGRTFNPASVAIPFSSLLRQLERDFDPVQRSKPDIKAALFSNVPVAARANDPALDILGDAIANRPFDWLARASVDGTPEARIYRAFGAKDLVPTSVWSYKGKMEPEQFYQFTKERGALLKESLMRNDAAFLKLIESSNEEVAAKILENLSRSATQMARVRVGYLPEVKTKTK